MPLKWHSCSQWEVSHHQLKERIRIKCDCHNSLSVCLKDMQFMMQHDSELGCYKRDGCRSYYRRIKMKFILTNCVLVTWDIVKFKVLTVRLSRIHIFWDVMLCCWVGGLQCFKGTSRLSPNASDVHSFKKVKKKENNDTIQNTLNFV